MILHFLDFSKISNISLSKTLLPATSLTKISLARTSLAKTSLTMILSTRTSLVGSSSTTNLDCPLGHHTIRTSLVYLHPDIYTWLIDRPSMVEKISNTTSNFLEWWKEIKEETSQAQKISITHTIFTQTKNLVGMTDNTENERRHVTLGLTS